MKRLACAAIFLLARSPSLEGASVPDWLKPGLDAPVASMAGAAGAVIVADSCEVRYLTADRVRRTYRQAIRVLAEAGRSHASTGHGYHADSEKIISARAWIVDPGGRHAESIKEREFRDTVAQASPQFWNSIRGLGIEAASRTPVGGIFAWEVVIESDGSVMDNVWRFRRNVPVWRSEFEVVPPAGATLRWHRSHPAVPEPSTRADGALRWEMTTIRTSEQGWPDGFLLDDLEVRVQAIAPGRREGALRDWNDLNRLIAAIVEPRIDLSPEVRAKAADLTAGTSNRWERIHALCGFAQRDVQYLSLMLDRDHLAGYRPRASSEVLRDRLGDCKDKAAFLIAMLRAVGDRGYLVLVHARDRLAISQDWPTTGFNHAIAAIPADADTPAHWPVIEAGALGRLVLFDPTHPGVPLGALPASDQGRHIFITSTEAGACVTSPVESPEDARIVRTIEATIARSGALVVKARESRPGAAGAELYFRRTALRAERFTQELADVLQTSLPAVESLSWTDSWEPRRPALTLDLEFSAPQFVRVAGPGRWLLRPHVLTPSLVLKPWETTLEGSAWLPTLSGSQVTRLVLPAGIEPDEPPATLTIDEAGLRAHCTWRHEAGVLVAEYSIERPARALDRPDYEAWRIAHQRLHDALRAPLMLRRTPQTAP